MARFKMIKSLQVNIWCHPPANNISCSCSFLGAAFQRGSRIALPFYCCTFPHFAIDSCSFTLRWSHFFVRYVHVTFVNTLAFLSVIGQMTILGWEQQISQGEDKNYRAWTVNALAPKKTCLLTFADCAKYFDLGSDWSPVYMREL